MRRARLLVRVYQTTWLPAREPWREEGETRLVNSNTLNLASTVRILSTCQEVEASSRPGESYAATSPRADGRGWLSRDEVHVRRADGSPLDPRILDWLFSMAGLISRPAPARVLEEVAR